MGFFERQTSIYLIETNAVPYLKMLRNYMFSQQQQQQQFQRTTQSQKETKQLLKTPLQVLQKRKSMNKLRNVENLQNQNEKQAQPQISLIEKVQMIRAQKALQSQKQIPLWQQVMDARHTTVTHKQLINDQSELKKLIVQQYEPGNEIKKITSPQNDQYCKQQKIMIEPKIENLKEERAKYVPLKWEDDDEYIVASVPRQLEIKDLLGKYQSHFQLNDAKSKKDEQCVNQLDQQKEKIADAVEKYEIIDKKAKPPNIQLDGKNLLTIQKIFEKSKWQ